eukprot:scaffold1484_cov173-Amphora_coffeaeformis.AAC.12
MARVQLDDTGHLSNAAPAMVQGGTLSSRSKGSRAQNKVFFSKARDEDHIQGPHLLKKDATSKRWISFKHNVINLYDSSYSLVPQDGRIVLRNVCPWYGILLGLVPHHTANSFSTTCYTLATKDTGLCLVHIMDGR